MATRGSWAKLRKLFLVSLIIGSFLEVLNAHGYLGFLDRAVFGLVEAVGRAGVAGNAVADPKTPVIVEIDGQAWESLFGEASPLDRGTLAAVVQLLTSQHPTLLAIDVDLSPAPRGDGAAQDALEAALGQAVHGGLPVVMVAPLPLGSPAGILAKLRWAEDLSGRLGSGFALASPCLDTSQQVLLRYAPHAPRLGQVAARMTAAGHGHPPASAADHGEAARDAAHGPGFAATANVFGPCASTPGHHDVAVHGGFYAAYDADLRQHRLRPDSPQATRAWLRPGPDGIVLEGAPITGRPVFLGGTFSDQDLIVTSSGRFPGVVAHAAIFTTINGEKWHHLRAWLPFLFDLLLGVSFGLAFERLWEAVNDNGSAFSSRRRDVLTGASDAVAPVWTAYLRWFAACAGIAMLLLGTAGGLVATASLLASHGVWLNPAGMVLGIVLHNLVSSRDRAEAAHGAYHRPAGAYKAPQEGSAPERPQDASARLRLLAALPWHPGFVLYCLVWLSVALVVAAAARLIFGE